MSRSAHPHVHQDYLARIRYSNAVPPPPFYPKFLDIPNTGLSSGLYTSSNYASRLAREQPLNIEADAELGMPIDLVGIKGVFDGDETAIQAEDDPAPLHPRDRELLRPLNALNKPVASTSAVSFLRRTEYISSSSAVNKLAAGKQVLRTPGGARKRRPDDNKDDPLSILRGVVKGFDIAYPQDAFKGTESEQNLRGAQSTAQERSAWADPVHPVNKKLTVLDSYPLLPDLDAFPDGLGSYMIFKYQTNPSNFTDHYDPRLDVAIIRPLPQTEEEVAAHKERLALASSDSSRMKPHEEYRYDVYVPEDESSVTNIKRKFNTDDPENDDEELYDFEDPESGKKAFRYKRLRTYETYQQVANHGDPWNDTVALFMNDGGNRLAKGAYVYPVSQRTSLRAERPRTLGRMARGELAGDQGEDRIDVYDLRVREQIESELERAAGVRAKYDPVSEESTS